MVNWRIKLLVLSRSVISDAMAFGKSTESKRIKNAVLEDSLWTNHIKSEDHTNKNWKNKWDWILQEYGDLHTKLQELSKDSAFLSGVNKNLRDEDKRSIKPVPETTNHEYGWLARMPEFELEKYGPDVDKGLPLPDKYHIFKEQENPK